MRRLDDKGNIESNAIQIKIGVLGDGGVGKSALTSMFVSSIFPHDYDPTIEDSFRKVIHLDGMTVNLIILDTAGQDVFRGMREAWARECEGFLIVYAINQKGSLEQAEYLYNVVERSKGRRYPCIVLAGNKCDLEGERIINPSDGEKLASQWNVQWMEVSAKNKIRNHECFEECVRSVLLKRKTDLEETRLSRSNQSCTMCELL